MKITINVNEHELEKILGLIKIEGNSKGCEKSASIYARFFDDSCIGWTNDANYNLTFLKSQQCYANAVLENKGELYLNEVYDMLGIPRSKAGQIVGWRFNKEHPTGDNFVDFGLDDPVNADFMNGYKRVALLDFNVDGNIIEF